MYDLKQAKKNFVCFNCSLYPVEDAEKARWSKATRGSVLHWHVRALQLAHPLVLRREHR